MGLHSGQGTLVTVGGSSAVRVTDLTFKDTGILADATDCGSLGQKERAHVLSDASFSMNVLFRDEQLPDTDLSLRGGDSALLVFTLGNSGKTYEMTFIVENLTFSITKDDLIKWALDGFAQGVFLRPAT